MELKIPALVEPACLLQNLGHAQGKAHQSGGLCSEQTLTSDVFWKLIERMTEGRRLVITSDHGYAACGLFNDVSDRDQVAWLKTNFGSMRFAHGAGTPHHWMPPISLCLTTAHGEKQFALGRRKWKSAGGYPTLAHGGLSLLEVAVPFLEISKL
jgi:hypothetical protein